VGLKADFQGYGTTNHNFFVTNALGQSATINAGANMFTYLFGPQIKSHGRFEPFGEALFGGAHSNTYANLFKSGFFAGGTSPSNNGFGMALGGGIDVKVSHKVAIRVGEFDYLLTRFSNPVTQNNHNQNNFRYNAGLVFQF
jgi:opacity protein-like surface antigen